MFHKENKKTIGDRHFSRGPVLDNLEALVVAVILALVLRCFLVEAFAIPSGSMGPTLLGNHLQLTCSDCGYGFVADPPMERFHAPYYCPNCGSEVDLRAHGVWGGDRILVNKILYRFDKPSRWDPFVFISPVITDADKTTFIKRLIGLPSEKLEIIRGDIIINGQIQRKTAAAQRSLWMLVYDSKWPWTGKDAWMTGSSSAWTQTRGKGLLSVDARSSTRPESAVFAGHQSAGAIGDTYIYDHYGYNAGRGTQIVTDVKMTLDVTPQSPGSLILALPEDTDELKCVLPVEGSSDRGQVTLRDIPLGNVDVKLTLNKVTRVEFSRVDYLITLNVAGKEVFRKDMWDNLVYGDLVRQGQAGILQHHTRSGVRIAADNLKAEFPWIRIDRDVYYGSGYYSEGYGAGPSEIRRSWGAVSPFGPETMDQPDYIGPINLGPNQYLALGDNSPRSSDSRYWGPVPGDNLIGKALLVWWYPTRVRFIH